MNCEQQARACPCEPQSSRHEAYLAPREAAKREIQIADAQLVLAEGVVQSEKLVRPAALACIAGQDSSSVAPGPLDSTRGQKVCEEPDDHRLAPRASADSIMARISFAFRSHVYCSEVRCALSPSLARNSARS